MIKKGLFLAGGGARGAYQAGVLKAINEILQTKHLPFDMITGVSIGSFNAAVIAQHADDFSAGVTLLEQLWRSISSQQIFNSSNYDLGKSVFRNLSHVIIKQREAGHLLDTAPLHDFINANINFSMIQDHITSGLLTTFEVISSCYETQQTVSFYEHHATAFEDWQHIRHVSQRTDIGMQHIQASTALPLFFPIVNIDGFHYGDGSMGLVSPLRGMLRFGMEKILVLGTHPESHAIQIEHLKNSEIGFANILGSMLNGLFLDNLERDIEMINRMNEIANLLSLWKKRRSPWRSIEMMDVRPSVNIAQIAQLNYQFMPRLLRFLLNSLGAQSHSGELVSFLLFEKEFTGALFELGYQDGLVNASKLRSFFQ